jgi:hypothetical protein
LDDEEFKRLVDTPEINYVAHQIYTGWFSAQFEKNVYAEYIKHTEGGELTYTIPSYEGDYPYVLSAMLMDNEFMLRRERLHLLSKTGKKNLLRMSWGPTGYWSWEIFSLSNLAYDKNIRKIFFGSYIEPFILALQHGRGNDADDKIVYGMTIFEEKQFYGVSGEGRSFALDLPDRLYDDCNNISKYDFEINLKYVHLFKEENLTNNKKCIYYCQDMLIDRPAVLLCEFKDDHDSYQKPGSANQTYDKYESLYRDRVKGIYGEDNNWGNVCAEYSSCINDPNNLALVNNNAFLLSRICYTKEKIGKRGKSFEELDRQDYRTCIKQCHNNIKMKAKAQGAGDAAAWNIGIAYNGDPSVSAAHWQMEMSPKEDTLWYPHKSTFGFPTPRKDWIYSCNLSRHENKFREYSDGCLFKDNAISKCQSNYPNINYIPEYATLHGAKDPFFGQDSNDAPVWLVNNWIVDDIVSRVEGQFADELNKFHVKSYVWIGVNALDFGKLHYEQHPNMHFYCNPYNPGAALIYLSSLRKVVPLDREIIYQAGYGMGLVNTYEQDKILAGYAAAYGPTAISFYSDAFPAYAFKHGDTPEEKTRQEATWNRRSRLFQALKDVPVIKSRSSIKDSRILVIYDVGLDGAGITNRNLLSIFQMAKTVDIFTLRNAKHAKYESYDMVFFISTHGLNDNFRYYPGASSNGLVTSLGQWPISNSSEKGNPVLWDRDYMENNFPSVGYHLDEKTIQEFVKKGGIAVFIGPWNLGFKTPLFTSGAIVNDYNGYIAGVVRFSSDGKRFVTSLVQPSLNIIDASKISRLGSDISRCKWDVNSLDVINNECFGVTTNNADLRSGFLIRPLNQAYGAYVFFPFSGYDSAACEVPCKESANKCDECWISITGNLRQYMNREIRKVVASYSPNKERLLDQMIDNGGNTPGYLHINRQDQGKSVETYVKYGFAVEKNNIFSIADGNLPLLELQSSSIYPDENGLFTNEKMVFSDDNPSVTILLDMLNTSTTK